MRDFIHCKIFPKRYLSCLRWSSPECHPTLSGPCLSPEPITFSTAGVILSNSGRPHRSGATPARLTPAPPAPRPREAADSGTGVSPGAVPRATLPHPPNPHFPSLCPKVGEPRRATERRERTRRRVGHRKSARQRGYLNTLQAKQNTATGSDPCFIRENASFCSVKLMNAQLWEGIWSLVLDCAPPKAAHPISNP